MLVSGFDLYRDEVEARRRLVYVPDVPRFYLELTAWEHLRFIALVNQARTDFAPALAGAAAHLWLMGGAQPVSTPLFPWGAAEAGLGDGVHPPFQCIAAG